MSEESRSQADITAKNLNNAKELIEESIACLESSESSMGILSDKFCSDQNRVYDGKDFKLKNSIKGNFGNAGINIGLGLELVLKSLVFIDNVNKDIDDPHGHNLIQHFESLSPDIKKSANSKYRNSKSIKNLEKIRRQANAVINKNTVSKKDKKYISIHSALSAHKSVFTNWRYFYEDKKNGNLNPKLLIEIYKILLQLAQSKLSSHSNNKTKH